jgi:hypothetical protein
MILSVVWFEFSEWLLEILLRSLEAMIPTHYLVLDLSSSFQYSELELITMQRVSGTSYFPL